MVNWSEDIIWARMVLRLSQNFRLFCLVSGDSFLSGLNFGLNACLLLNLSEFELQH